MTESRQKSRRATKRVWLLCIKWKDGNTSREPLVSLKESPPVEIAEYAVSRKLHDGPDFAWWVPNTINKHTCIIAAVNAWYHKQMHKFDVRISKIVDDVYWLEKDNGNNYWAGAIQKEIKNARVAFNILHWVWEDTTRSLVYAVSYYLWY